MFDDTLKKFALVIGLFVVFVILGNIFAASRHAAEQKAAIKRRRSRRSRRFQQAGDSFGSGGPSDARGASLPCASPMPPESFIADEEDDPPSMKRRLFPQIALSIVAIGVAGLALYVMWMVAERG